MYKFIKLSMKALLITLFLAVNASAGHKSVIFTFPEHKHDFIYTLKDRMKLGHTVVIKTPYISSRKLTALLSKYASNIRLVLQDSSPSSRFLDLLQKVKIDYDKVHENSLCIGEFCCQSPQAFDETIWSEKVFKIVCLER